MRDYNIDAKAKGWEVLKSQDLKGDGCQAEGAIVLSHCNGYHPYVVHFFNKECGGFCNGDYCMNLNEALNAFETKLTRYGRHLIDLDLDTQAMLDRVKAL